MAANLRILLVDDNPETLELFHFCLKLAGHLIHMAADGREALQRLQELGDELDVIVTDQRMPGLSGLEMVEQIRQQWPDFAIPITLFTGDSGAAIETRARALGVARVLYKPLLPHTLLQIVTEVVAEAHQPTPVA